MSPKKVDSNQAEIVAYLRAIGCTVQSLHEIGRGCPDLLVGHQGRNFLLEVKSDKGKLTLPEHYWHQGWQGTVHVVRSFEEVRRVLDA